MLTSDCEKQNTSAMNIDSGDQQATVSKPGAMGYVAANLYLCYTVIENQ